MSSTKLNSQIESILFVSGEPVKISTLAKICAVPKDEIFSHINELNQSYQTKESGLLIIQKEELVQMATNPENCQLVNQLVKGELSSDLSRSALEVLSIIAYRGPIPRSQIEIIRGVNCSYVLRGLLVKGLVERREAADIRGYLYQISFDFLKYLGISSTRDLPDWNKLANEQKIDTLLENEES